MAATESPRNNAPDRIVFASCNSQHYDDELPKTLWPAILSRNASAFIWTGDAIYADDFHPPKSYLHYLLGKPSPKPATPPVIRDLYAHLTQSPGYRKLLETNVTILGALDDHDYGCNNGDVNYDHKLESNMAFVDFLRERREDLANLTLMARRAAAGKGVYGVKVFDFTRQPSRRLLSDEEAGLEPDVIRTPTMLSDRSVAVFLLDVRTNKTPWPRNWRKYFVDYGADFLGEAQWNWFEEALNQSTATVNIIVQGLQVHADRYFDGNTVESWSRFPSSQHRLYQTILKSSVKSPILVSGDVHMAELLRKDCRLSGRFDAEVSRMLLEVTTSGMTHSWGTNICARPTSSLACQSPHVAFSLMAGMHLAHNNYAWTDLVYEMDPLEGAKAGFQYSLARNFGELELDWENQRVLVRIFGSDTTIPLISTSWSFDDLSLESRPKDPPRVQRSDYERLQRDLMSQSSATPEDWICVNHGGQPSFFLKLFGVLSPVLLAGSIMVTPIAFPTLAFLLFRRLRVNKS